MWEIPGTLIPIVAIIMGIGCGMLGIYFDFRRKREEQETIRTAVEKGVELPEDLFERQNNRGKANPLRRGIIWTAVGFALFVALYINEGLDAGVWALIPLAAGIGYLFFYKLSPKNGDKKEIS